MLLFQLEEMEVSRLTFQKWNSFNFGSIRPNLIKVCCLVMSDVYLYRLHWFPVRCNPVSRVDEAAVSH